jgi:vacuolar-type H+-ATPase subunit E/Vma4
MPSQNKQMIERRSEPPEQSVWWSKLSLAQKFSASSLGKFGYELLFIRSENGRSLAVLSCNGGVAVVSEDGDINTTPNVKIRP